MFPKNLGLKKPTAMPKFTTFPTLYDDALILSITKLKEWGYLEPGQRKRGSVTWSRNGNKTGEIDIAVFTDLETPYLYLDYLFRGKEMKYSINLVSVPSNIGKGRVWYFLCPHTGKRCRKVYSIGSQFLHREAFSGCMYESQTRSLKNRVLIRQYDRYFAGEKGYEKIYSKHFKTHYAGKPTKRYLKLLKQIKQSEGISLSALMCS
jgi:hypothetical protein